MANVPTGVKIIAVLQYIGAVLLTLVGLVFLVGSGFIAQIVKEVPVLGAIGSAAFIFIGILIIVLGIGCGLIGWGLWNAKNWARVIVIVFCALGALSGLFSLLQGQFSAILDLAFNGIIGGYLLLNKNVKAAFA